MQNKILKLYIFSKEQKKGCGIMCKILRDIQGKSPEELLSIYGIVNEPPINIDKLVSNIGISVIPMDFSIIEKQVDINSGSILGAAIAQADNLNIFYRKNNTENRRRFTIAHELAHCCLHTNNLIDHHVEFRESDTFNKKEEREANIFAGKLLIPETALYNICNQLLVPSLDALTKIFKVSSTVMVARLEYLKMPYLKDIEINEV